MKKVSIFTLMLLASIHTLYPSDESEEIQHAQDDELTCPQCNTEYTTQQGLTLHMQTCGQTGQTMQHVALPTDPSQKQSNFQTTTPAEQLFTERTGQSLANDTNQKFYCHYCKMNNSFNSKEELIQHYANKQHSNKKLFNIRQGHREEFRCLLCGAGSACKQEAEDHENLHTRKKIYLCTGCTMQTYNVQSFRTHQKQCHKTNPLTDPIADINPSLEINDLGFIPEPPQTPGFGNLAYNPQTPFTGIDPSLETNDLGFIPEPPQTPGFGNLALYNPTTTNNETLTTQLGSSTNQPTTITTTHTTFTIPKKTFRKRKKGKETDTTLLKATIITNIDVTTEEPPTPGFEMLAHPPTPLTGIDPTLLLETATIDFLPEPPTPGFATLGQLHYFCLCCPEKTDYKSEENLISHYKNQHNETIKKNPNYRFSCHLCEQNFKKNRDLSYHYNRHYGEAPFACAKCPFKTDTKKSLSAHETSTGHKDNYTCPQFQCSQQFKSPQDLEDHINAHNDTPQHICPYCSKKHFYRDAYKTHIKKCSNKPQ